MVTWERRQAQHAARSHRLRPHESESTGRAAPEFLARDQLVGLIREAGREPVERDTVYNVVGQ